VERALLVARARAGGEDFAFHRLFLRGVGNDDAAGGLRLLLDTADQDAVLSWTQFHRRFVGLIYAGTGTAGLRVPTRNGHQAGKCNEENSAVTIFIWCFNYLCRHRPSSHHSIFFPPPPAEHLRFLTPIGVECGHLRILSFYWAERACARTSTLLKMLRSE
jgi:hypothetical protein